jgi:hypothetical protein
MLLIMNDLHKLSDESNCYILAVFWQFAASAAAFSGTVDANFAGNVS